MKLENINIVLENDIVFGSIEFKETITKINIKSAYKRGFPILTPGFIDSHIHGSHSFDVLDGTSHAIEGISLSLVKEGTTSYLPTPMTQSNEVIIKSLKSISDYYTKQNPMGAQIVGIHLEGPFINVEARGAQPKEYITPPNLKVFKRFEEASKHLIKKVSLAPELDGAKAFIQYLVERNILPSIAHTKASYDVALEAFHLGVNSLTHTYNAMSPIHHRDIGVVGLGYTKNVMCELIYDKIHVSPHAAKLLIKNATTNRVMLITDSMRHKGLEDGISELGGQKVIVKHGEARLENGSLAGSILKMIDGYKNLKELGYNYVQLAKMTATNAAQHFNLKDRGSLKAGLRSDFVLLSSSHEILKTYVNGLLVYSA